MLVNACVYACYSLVFLSDARCTIKQILRGLAPPHLLAGFMLILLSTLLAVFLFAAREFAGAAESQLFTVAAASLSGSYIIWMVVMFYGHFHWRSQLVVNEERARQSSSANSRTTDEGYTLSEVSML